MKNFILISLFIPSLSFATLGADSSSVSQDQVRMNAPGIKTSISKNARAGIQIHALSADGNTVKQFTNSSGTIVAISWRGRRHPDLRSLLGPYYAEFAELEARTPKGRRYLRHPLVTSQITVIRSGHLQDLRGVAFINGQLPAGLTQEDLL